MNTPLRNGHAVWAWLDLNGHGKCWHLVVPVANEDFDDDDDDLSPCWDALFPLEDDYRVSLEELDGCPMRQVLYPSTDPTPEELADAAERAADISDLEDLA